MPIQTCGRLLDYGHSNHVGNASFFLGRSSRQKLFIVFAAMVMAPVSADTGSQLVLAYVINRHGTRNLLPKLSSALKDANSDQQTVFAQPFGGEP